MKKNSKILVCIDLSDYSENTLESAVTIAGNTGAQIHIINVINRRDVSFATVVPPYYSGTIDVQGYVKDTTEKRKTAINKLIDNNFSDFTPPITIHVVLGTPFEEIIHTAVNENADLIVMGIKAEVTWQEPCLVPRRKRFSGIPPYLFSVSEMMNINDRKIDGIHTPMVYLNPKNFPLCKKS